MCQILCMIAYGMHCTCYCRVCFITNKTAYVTIPDICQGWTNIYTIDWQTGSMFPTEGFRADYLSPLVGCLNRYLIVVIKCIIGRLIDAVWKLNCRLNSISIPMIIIRRFREHFFFALGLHIPRKSSLYWNGSRDRVIFTLVLPIPRKK